jgi:hypothetical protein
LGLSPKPRRSTASSLRFVVAASSGNTVCAQKEDDDVKPWMKMASSPGPLSLLVVAAQKSRGSVGSCRPGD